MHAPCATRHAYARWRLCACVQLAQLLAVCRTVHAASDKLPQVPAAGLCRLPSASDWCARAAIAARVHNMCCQVARHSAAECWRVWLLSIIC